MFIRILRKSFSRGLKSKILAIITVAFGASLTSAMLNITLDIGDKVNKELKVYGANLQVLPKMDTLPLEIGGTDFNPLEDQQFINETDLPKLKMIFWAHNIITYSPYLENMSKLNGIKSILTGTWFNKKLTIPTGETVYLGIKNLKPWWEIKGNWADDERNEIMLGKEIAKQIKAEIGDVIYLPESRTSGQIALKVVAIVNGGEEADRKAFVPLRVVQQISGLTGKVQRIEVSALTTPENDLAVKAREQQNKLTSEEFDRWYCTAYVDSIAYQIEEAIPGVVAKPIRQVAQSEGVILNKIQLLMLLLTITALVSSILGISGLMTAKVLERSREIGLLKALGAEDERVTKLFLTEGIFTGLLGGLTGYIAGLGFAAIIAREVFSSFLTVKIAVLPMVLVISVGVVLIGSLSAMKYIIRLEPAHVLHGR